jgi:hypothetical protein
MVFMRGGPTGFFLAGVIVDMLPALGIMMGFFIGIMSLIYGLTKGSYVIVICLGLMEHFVASGVMFKELPPFERLVF